MSKTKSPVKASRRSQRDEKLILALLQNPSVEKAAEAANVGAATLWRRLQDPEFQRLYRGALRKIFSQAVGRLQHASGAAVGTLLRVMTDPSSPAASRVRAANCVLERSERAMELEEIEARLARLEQAQSSQTEWE